LAERLGYTIAELLTGTKQPIGAYEFSIWPLYFQVKARLEEDAYKKAERKGKNKK